VKHLRSESGFSLIELLVATALLLIVSATVVNALIQMSNSQRTIANRTEMHSGIRGATELLQQEVGQAGRLGLPGPNPAVPSATMITTAIAAPPAGTTCNPETPLLNSITVNVNSTAGMWATSGANASYILLTTLDGDNQESFRVAAVNAGSITACFMKSHAANTVVSALGGFATGIVPPAGVLNGSTGNVLKMYGDINGDGNMVYVEYTCDTNAHKLYRIAMPITQGAKSPLDDSKILLNNIVANPGGTPCFTYQTATNSAQGTSFTFVLDVAVTLTVETEQVDPITRQKQTETKALLNVSPRNVFNSWALVNIGYTDRVQSTPTSVTALLAQ
jgi:prepilin-type N-terminal cleavage/methylation domain-containing protein